MSAATAVPAAWALYVPVGWHQLPALGEEPGPILRAIVDSYELEPAARVELSRSLVGLLDLVRVLKPGRRVSYGLVADAAKGVADAVLSVRVTKILDEGYGEYLAAIEQATTGPSIRIINREVAEARLPAGRVILLSDVLVQDDQQGIVSPALERGIAALFLDALPVLLEIHVSTQNLGRFANIAEFALEIAAGYAPDTGE